MMCEKSNLPFHSQSSRGRCQPCESQAQRNKSFGSKPSFIIYHLGVTLRQMWGVRISFMITNEQSSLLKDIDQNVCFLIGVTCISQLRFPKEKFSLDEDVVVRSTIFQKWIHWFSNVNIQLLDFPLNIIYILYLIFHNIS